MWCTGYTVASCMSMPLWIKQLQIANKETCFFEISRWTHLYKYMYNLLKLFACTSTVQKQRMKFWINVSYLQENLGDTNLEVWRLPKHLLADMLACLFMVRELSEQLWNQVLVAFNKPKECVTYWITSFANTNGFHHSWVAKLPNS